ncbi:MAG: TIGR01440 family protein [Bacillota bacterium]
MNSKKIINDFETAVLEIISLSGADAGDIMVIGGSSSEIKGEKIGSSTDLNIGEMIIKRLIKILEEKNIYSAVQGCEHINRALVVEKKYAEEEKLEEVNVIPHRNAGGAFATAAYKYFYDPVMVENIRADFGIDIGDTFIGMHLKEVVVPVRLSIKIIGEAHLTACRTRPRMIGGDRARHKKL